MGIISLEKSNHLYWLGRYSERAFTTIRIFMDAYDTMLDQDPNAYKHICEKLHIRYAYNAEKIIFRHHKSETEKTENEFGDVDIKATIVAATADAVVNGELDSAFAQMQARQQGVSRSY